MKKLLILILFPLMMFSQDSTLVGDVDCSGEVNSQDASLILQFVTNVIDTLPCEANMTGLTPDQLQEIINMMDEQLSINYSGGSNYPVMISNISSEIMNWTSALIYCADLEEDGYSDWVLPNEDQLTYALGGGLNLPDQRVNDGTWTRSRSNSTGSGILAVYELSNNGIVSNSAGNELKCRCVRFGETQTNEGSGNSSGSASSVGGNSEQPIAMIGPMYITDEFEFTSVYELNYETTDNAMYYFDAVRFCAELEYNGFNDWFLPSLNQLQSYYENNISIGIVIPNFIIGESEFWTRINNSNIGSAIHTVRIKSSDSSLPNQMSYINDDGGSSLNYCFCVR